MTRATVGGTEVEVDARIRYPCYKSFDDLIDVERLRSLDAYMVEIIERHAREAEHSYFQSEHRLDHGTAYEPGVREIWLSRNRPGVAYDYLNLNEPEAWERAPEADEFALLSEFIGTLPFKATGRILIIYDDDGNAVPAHRDHLYPELCHEFVWMRTNMNKPFFVLNEKNNERAYVESYSAWFDTVNQYHGADMCSGLSFSIRVDGIFSDELRKRIPRPRCNAASTPALWACTAATR